VNTKKALLHSFAAAVVVILLVNTLSGQEVRTLHPIFFERDAVLMPAAEGDWVLPSPESETVSIRKAGDNFYHLRYAAGGVSSLFEAGFIRVGNMPVLDLCPVIADTVGNSYYKEHLMGAHSSFRVSLENDTLRLASLNYRWFYDQVITKKSPLDYSWVNNSLLLTISTDELRKFIAAHAIEKNFFQEDFILKRVPKQAIDKTAIPQPQRAQAPIANNWAQARHDCLPSFPLKEGWLGGDGDISIPLGPSKTLWIFNDTFVGKKEQVSRIAAQMISNSVAITTCEPNRQSAIQYFWKDQYTDHPKPVFETYTGRYRYWPCAAFMNKNILYVLLLKIGPKPEAAPGDIFNFKGVGMSLARIADPTATTPDLWQVELFPWSRVLDPDAWGCCAAEGVYLYMFVKGQDQTAALIRINLDDVESPEGHIEYYANGDQWKAGLPADDRKVIFSGDSGNTVCYHPDLKQWVMVYGPDFMNNKIRIRTASALTGPWSEGQLIYQCPEQTLGSAAFESDNFCYLGREHIQFYDTKTRTLLLTYDCNSANFSKLVSDNSIYVPRVLSIPLKKKRR
jgi:hypothetical protein